jgi:hypothetical protein
MLGDRHRRLRDRALTGDNTDTIISVMTAAGPLLVAVALAALACGCSTRTLRSDATPSTASGPAPRLAQLSRAAATVRVLEKPTTVITLPVSVIQNDASAGATDRLTIRDEKQDQEAEGPQSFDVLADGGIVVTDPLRGRLLVFDRNGKMRNAIDVKLPTRTVTAMGDLLRIVTPSQAPKIINMKGETVPPSAIPSAANVPPPTPPAQVSLDPGRRAGTVRFTAPARGAAAPAAASDLNVSLDAKDSRLASVRVITVDPQRRPYLAVEVLAGEGASATRFTKMVRRYGADGKLDVEIRSIPTDYLVVPVTEFRVVRDAVYQLLPHREAVLINVWDLAR